MVVCGVMLQFMVSNRAVFATAMLGTVLFGTVCRAGLGCAGMLMMRACVRFDEVFYKKRRGAAGTDFVTGFDTRFNNMACVVVLVMALVEMTHHMHVRSQLTEAQRCNQQYV